MGVQMVESTIGFFAAIPTTLVHAFDFFVPPTWPLVLLGARNGDKRVDRGEWVPTLRDLLVFFLHTREIQNLVTRRVTQAEHVAKYGSSNLQLVDAEQGKPSQAQADPMSQREHSAYLAGDNALPTQVATRTLGFGAAQDSAAYRGVGYKESTAVDEDR